MESASRASHRGRFSDTDKRSRALALPVERSSRYPFPHFPFGLRGDRVSPVVRFLRTQITLEWIPVLSQKRSDPNIMANSFNHRLLVRRETIS
jgi:hypothetical protein